MELLGKLSFAFNASWFKDATILDAEPPKQRPQPRKSPARRPPATKRNLKLVPPPTVH